MDLGVIVGLVGASLSLMAIGLGFYLFYKFKRALNFIGTGAAEKSVEVKAAKAIEKAVAGDLLSKYPEISMLLDQLSPDTAELVKKNPQLAITLIQRYQPLIEKYLPMLTGSKEGSKIEYDL